MDINATDMHFEKLNDMVRHASTDTVTIKNALGHRYIGAGNSGKKINIHGTPGNALGAYLNGSTITVYGNAQDATGDTMNNGEIIIHGNGGDTLGYAMRGGEIYVEGNAGYRVGIHMKEYKQYKPVIVVGGHVGSFLGEYQAGGIIVVLGLNTQDIPVERYCGTGMHGGKIFIRSSEIPKGLPEQVMAEPADKEDMLEIQPYIKKFCKYFHNDMTAIAKSQFIKLTPNSRNPYHMLYTNN